MKQPKLSQSIAKQYQDEMGRDLTAAFRIKNEETLKILNKALREKWTLDQIDEAISQL